MGWLGDEVNVIDEWENIMSKQITDVVWYVLLLNLVDFNFETILDITK